MEVTAAVNMRKVDGTVKRPGQNYSKIEELTPWKKSGNYNNLDFSKIFHKIFKNKIYYTDELQKTLGRKL